MPVSAEYTPTEHYDSWLTLHDWRAWRASWHTPGPLRALLVFLFYYLIFGLWLYIFWVEPHQRESSPAPPPPVPIRERPCWL